MRRGIRYANFPFFPFPIQFLLLYRESRCPVRLRVDRKTNCDEIHRKDHRSVRELLVEVVNSRARKVKRGIREKGVKDKRRERRRRRWLRRSLEAASTDTTGDIVLASDWKIVRSLIAPSCIVQRHDRHVTAIPYETCVLHNINHAAASSPMMI